MKGASQMILVSLIGEQPIPNLLAARQLAATRNLLFYAEKTRQVAEKLQQLLPGASLEPIEPFDFEAALRAFETRCPPHSIINLTGGTKVMAFAAYEFAHQKGLPAVYVESDQQRSRLFRLDPDYRQQAPLELPALITIEDYLRAFLGERFGARRVVPDNEGHRFEHTIAEAIRPVVDEAKEAVSLQGVVDLDLVVRCGNQVGILEAKLGKNDLKHAIDQLNTAGGQKYLGTYTRKFLVSDQDWGAFSDLKELAEARQITVIELPGSRGQASLSAENAAKLRQAVLSGLGRQPIVNPKAQI
jgi:hypothetical protein